MAEQPSSNPVVKKTRLHAFPGWTVRRYENGWYDGAHDGLAVTPLVETFQDVLVLVKAQK
jgi:hypothetical protein